MSTRRSLYRAARILGDLDAASRGAGSLGRRAARRVAYRSVNRSMSRILRRMGL